MSLRTDIERRKFLITVGKAFPVTIGALYLIGCGDHDDPMGTGSMVITAQSTVNAGHSHSADVPEADLDSTQSKSYGSTSSSGHTHSVTLTAANFETLRNSGSVTVTSTSNSGHTHNFTFRT